MMICKANEKADAEFKWAVAFIATSEYESTVGNKKLLIWYNAYKIAVTSFTLSVAV